MTDFLFNREVRVEFTNRDDPDDVVVIGTPDPSVGEQVPKIIGAEPLKIDFQVAKQLSTEHNRADIDISNISDDSASKINFRKPTLAFRFGRKVEIFAGYEGRIKKIFSGVVISAITSREATIKVTRIECRNIFYELMQLPINISFPGGDDVKKENKLKSNAILKILKIIGATITPAGEALLKSRLGDTVFKDATNFTGTAWNVINQINRGLTSSVVISFDDVATSFNPVGIPLDEPPTIYDQSTGLLGTPQPTEIGADFKIMLDPDLKISSPVLLLSDTIQAFFGAGTEFTTTGRFVVKQIVHSGTNRADGVFESRVISVFNRTNQIETTFAVA